MPPSIMVVDDDESLRSLMQDALGASGYAVYLAANGRQALELVKEIVPDIFIVDVMMPEMSGYELIEQLRANTQTVDRYIFVLSARSDQASVEEGLQAGADRYLIKPIHPQVVISYIQEVLMKRGKL